MSLESVSNRKQISKLIKHLNIFYFVISPIHHDGNGHRTDWSKSIYCVFSHLLVCSFKGHVERIASVDVEASGLGFRWWIFSLFFEWLLFNKLRNAFKFRNMLMSYQAFKWLQGDFAIQIQTGEDCSVIPVETFDVKHPRDVLSFTTFRRMQFCFA